MKSILLMMSLVLFCATLAQAEEQVSGESTWYRLHFGMGVGTDSITPELFNSFLDKQVTPLFPKGLTIISARGQWQSTQFGLIKEKTMVVDVDCEEQQECQKKIDTIANAYVKRFKKAKASLFVRQIPGITTILRY